MASLLKYYSMSGYAAGSDGMIIRDHLCTVGAEHAQIYHRRSCPLPMRRNMQSKIAVFG
jgi:hypothetical protein